MFTVRFDMRAPSTGAPTTELYPAVIDMCAWVESRRAIVAVLSEHHGAEDRRCRSHRCAVGCRRSWRGRIWNAQPRWQLEHADEGEP